MAEPNKDADSSPAAATGRIIIWIWPKIHKTIDTTRELVLQSNALYILKFDNRIKPLNCRINTFSKH